MHQARRTHQKSCLHSISSPVLQIHMAQPSLREQPGNSKREGGQPDMSDVLQEHAETETRGRCLCWQRRRQGHPSSPLDWGEGQRYNTRESVCTPFCRWDGVAADFRAASTCPATGTPRDPMSNTHPTSLLWFTVWMPLSALVIQTPREWRQVGTQEGDSSCPYGAV